MIIYQAPSVTVEYNEEKQQIIQKWKGYSSSDVFREAIMKTAEFGRANKAKSLVSDTSEQSVVKPEDIVFAASRMPITAMGNIKAIAFILPKNVFAQLSLKKFEQAATTEIIKYFDSYERAQEWIDTRIK